MIVTRIFSVAWPLVCSISLLLGGCARKPPVPAHAIRLVSTAPHLTEIVCSIGAGDLLAGRTDVCDYPQDQLASVPVTGGFGTPWLEPLLSVYPTHLLASLFADPALERRLTTLQVPVVHIPSARLSQIGPAILQVGELTRHRQEAQALAERINAGLETARQSTARLDTRPRVVFLLTPETPITTGRHAFVAELLELAGGLNSGRDSLQDYYHVSLEWLLLQEPDLIICLFDIPSPEPAAFFAAQAGWRTLKAIRQRRVYTCRDLSAVSRPGPRVLEGLAQLQEILARDARLHPSCLPPATVNKEPE